MPKIFDHNHVEIVPQENLRPQKLCWYLPYFGLYYPKKKDKIRVVFDAAAESSGMSLNKLLLSGPDLTNNLLGVLLADIEQMFTLSRRNTETFYGFCDTRIKTQTA